jgi:Lrp/AsnC family transcriptional regulator for asnA, asnC and gidA
MVKVIQTLVLDADILDDINIQLLNILSLDSSKPFVEIAREIGVSDATVHLRISRLVSAGIIKNFTISTNYSLIGYDHLAFVGVNLAHGTTDQVTRELSKHIEILEVQELHSRFDLLLKIRTKSLENLRNIVVNKIRSLPEVIDAELMPVVKTAKEEFVLPLEEQQQSGFSDSVVG